MSKNNFNLKSGRIFPFQFLLLGIVLVFIGIVLIVYNPYFAPLIILAGGMILTGNRGILFDENRKVFKEYNSFLFFKFGKWVDLDDCEYIFINSSKSSQKVYTRVNLGTDVVNIEYDAYLKLSNGEKIYLMSQRKKENLLERLEDVSKYLEVEVVDNTSA